LRTKPFLTSATKSYMSCNILGKTITLLMLAVAPRVLDAQGFAPEPAETLHVVVDPSRTGAAIPEYFIGWSYEKTILTQRRVFAPENSVLRRLFENLGNGNWRIGAGAVEETGWTRERRTPSAGDKTVTADDLDRFYAFVNATGWNVVHAVNCRR
jgi:hypothetical protein